MIGFDQIRCVCICCGFPCVIAIGISFPMDQVLQGPITPDVSMVTDLLHFVLFFIVDKVRW